MRFIGILTKDGVDPFSLTHELESFWREHGVLPEEPILIYKSDPNAAIVECWGKGRIHVVLLSDSQNMVKDFVALLLVAESVDLPRGERDAFIDTVVTEAHEHGVMVTSLICSGCPT
jgi:hypothetical protein